MSVQKKFEDSMRSFGPISSAKIFLAISGGLDSVVLAHLLRSSGYDCTWLHMNFQLRGQESERDQHFVEELSSNWGQPLRVSRVDAASYAAKMHLSIQEAARQLRYQWFSEQIVAVNSAAILLTAHHADDNAETLLMNFLRGTGIKGLTGIPVSNEHIRRPLLCISREELEEYARANGIDYVEDSSNQKAEYTRNRIRLELMPLLRELYPQVDSNLRHNIDRFRSVYAIYRQSVDRWLHKYVTRRAGEQQVSCALLLQPANRAMLHEWLSHHGFTEAQEGELIRMGESQSGHFMLSASGKFRILRHRKHFILSEVLEGTAESVSIAEEDAVIVFPGGELRVFPGQLVSATIPDSSDQAWLDGSDLQFPLLLRKWRAGDYFYPLGMNKKKKLSRFLIDQKLSITEKEKVWVLESGQRIVWVIGYRIDHRFRVREQSRSVCRIELFR